MSVNPHEFAKKPPVHMVLWIQIGEFERDENLFAETVDEALRRRREKYPDRLPAGVLLVDGHHFRRLLVGEE